MKMIKQPTLMMVSDVGTYVRTYLNYGILRPTLAVLASECHVPVAHYNNPLP